MLFFAISIFLYLLQNFSNKQFSYTVKRSSTGITLVQNGVCVFCAAATLLCIGGFKILPIELMLLAVAFGCLYLLTVFLLLKAFTLGPMGNSTLLCNVGMFISAFYGIVRFGDDFTAFIALGAVLLFLAVLLCTPTDKEQKNGGLTWFLVALSSGLSNGIVASVKREAVALCPDDVQTFLFWGFLFAAIAALVVITLFKKNRADAATVIKRPKLLVCGILAGVGTAGANFFQMLALKTVSSAIVYPLTSGVLVVALWLASYLLYKETKLKVKNILAVIFCVAAIILVNIK